MTKAMKCAMEVAKWLGKNELNSDTSIYVDNKRYKVSDAGELVYDIDAEPKDYLQYAGDFMSMTFEGPLYAVINENWYSKTYQKLESELSAIFKKYGWYYEQGEAWNLSLYDL